ncbi:MAG: DUF6629 family protein [Gemmatimonadaceae bacterium]
MCFSAGVSFGASAVLGGIGAASIASNTSSERRLFAATPLLFAAQQAAEGFVWRTMGHSNDGDLQRAAVNLFLAFALVLWPVWLPLSLERFEQNPVRKRLLRALVLIGACVSVGSATMLIRNQATASIAGRSVHYDFAGDQGTVISLLMLAAYLVPTLAPYLVTTAPKARRIGVMLVFSVAAAAYVQKEALTSVWCFFGSILSGLILLSVREMRSANASTMTVWKSAPTQQR